MPIERLEDAAQGIWASLQGEKCQLDCLILIAKQIFSVLCHLAAPRGTLKIVFQLELVSARPSPQLREPDNLRTFVSSPQVDTESRVLHMARLKGGLATTQPLRSDELRAISAWLKERARMKPIGKAFFVSEQRKQLHRYRQLAHANVRQSRFPAPARPSPHAAPRLRLRPG